MRIHWSGIEWGGRHGDDWWVWLWNWLPPELRYFGYRKDWYDGPLSHFGWWFGNVSWRLPWTNHDGGIQLPDRKPTAAGVPVRGER